MSTNKQANRLINEISPYLLQHAHNPVDWFPWGQEALDKAKAEDKPIFLSIGYSTCHWCHVMERESFEDEEVAQILNKSFVSIKVDREERPDIDSIYMSVCQAITGRGGWPLTIFMTPDQKPFYAGTYYPKESRGGRTGLVTLLDRITDAWKNNRSMLLESGDKIKEAITQDVRASEAAIIEEHIHEAYEAFEHSFDEVYAGFGNAPKFPSPHNLSFLLRFWYLQKEESALNMVERTLDAMYRGGIFDHIGFGFSRYSTDRQWLVPHFEKMLYDNALLTTAYSEAYLATKNDRYAKIAEEIITYVLRDMTSPDGGFYSAEDADSEGEEGKFYVWTRDEVIRVLGEPDGQKFCKYYNITQTGNFEGHSIPNLIHSEIPESDREFAEKCRKKLFEYREKRIHPHKDDKILTSWNGLMIAALAIAARIPGKSEYAQAAEKAVEFIYSHLLRDDGRLLARYRDGETAIPAYADDYAFLGWGLLELYETTYNPEFLEKAIRLTEEILRLFWDKENGGLFIYGEDSEQLITRPKEFYDGAAPSSNSVTTLNLLRLARLTADEKYEKLADRQLKAFGSSARMYPQGHSFFLIAQLFALAPTKEIFIVTKNNHTEAGAMLDVLSEEFRPFTVTLLHNESKDGLARVAPIVQNYRTLDGKATAYVCENFTCRRPVTDLNEFRAML